ncbi:low molecular weight protein arginine phosphatase [Brevibacillus fluminis]|uniref:Low molecular weight protein arginine phosphatase n=1 Tax=Brevibacillus fluminis TaxID=511487 RepID=A0A3M8D362_9BACL|nr:low molecular weight protein arginine phosphatase [Brevibacillus fluminis]RNB82031.1 low molecular weight protein arginine phosphatase [Brevibacillus fluminis]
MKVLFVCTGNTCRSPMAEALFRDKTEGGFEVKSAGVSAYVGQRASEHARKVLELRGIAHDHAAQRVDDHLIAWADLILTMTHGHKAMIQQYFPGVAHKLYTLKEFVGESGEVADPYGGDFTLYQHCATELEQTLDKLHEKLRGWL